ncbi:pepsin/retropepsin-like aspartic protease family protein [Alteromonas sp. ASW11-36]|uniref:Pepsin/retropepsin-like aspartic protease family protein n=1 Tax=Alteromonas arenosi TaxID=3055817 RepID=A0ABT7SYF2_9ALTE|nr:pepsin/retropepsin-like aspartic protease family protein [Alteromonas sp. ASW11-36]MDM7861215.1 pepsin/retropepsin-like aspartic protease family protein [Alteromonas sp. ASW11-36]
MKTLSFFVLTIWSSFSLLSHAQMQQVPLNKTSDGHFEILASINGVEAIFVLDSGATGTVIDTSKLSIFGISKGQEIVNGVRVGDSKTGRIETFPVEIAKFSIGKKPVDIKTIYSNNISGQFGTKVMGIVGYDALKTLKALLDVKNSQLLIPENTSDVLALLDESNGAAFETISLHQSEMGFNYIDIRLSENHVRLLVDSGASQTVLDQSTLTQFGFKLENHPSAKSVIDEGVELPMKVYKNGEISLGSVTLKGDFFTSDFTALMNAVNVDGEPQLIGILGNQQLIQLNSIVDFGNAKLHIKNY